MRIKNPILRRELLHQQRTTPRVLQIVDSVGIIACVVVLTGLLIRILIQQFEPNSGAYGELQMIQWGQVFSWVVHALASIRAVVAGTEVIRRDSNGPNWDDLKLVNISPLRFFFGKWWAAFYRVRGWMVALGMMQLALVGIMMSYYLMSMYKEHLDFCHFDITRHNDYVNLHCVIEWDDDFKSWQTWSPLLVPLSISSAITLSIMEMMTSTAMGVTFGLLLRGNLLGLLLGLIARIAPVIYYSAWPDEYSSQYYLYSRSEIWWWRWYEYTWFSLADGGTTAIMRMVVTPGWFVQYSRSPEGIFTALAAGLGLLALLFVGAMLVSWVVLLARGFRGARLLF